MPKAKGKPGPARGRKKTSRGGIKKPFPVVGIGASAGGLEAFTMLLASLPPDTGMAFVFIEHLAPEHVSRLPEILSGSTEMPVMEATDGMPVEPDHVYIIPPNTDMAISKGALALSSRSEFHGRHMPVDFFFGSLAESLKAGAMGVVLSGTASDGTAGVRAIKAAGGITFAQEEKSAKYGDMPRNAIASGHVDFVLPPEGIAEKLVEVSRHPRPALPEKRVAPTYEGVGLGRVFEILRKKTGVDFASYKQPTIMRRLKRRMSLHKIAGLDGYIKLLERDPAEVEALFNDILILVTGFFRDPKLFRALKTTVFPEIIKGRPRDSAIRVWVPGCSTGEEAYSIAMALFECLEKARSAAPVQIFGTDLNGQAVEKARRGIYREDALRGVSPERLRRFFVKAAGGYQVIKSVRGVCVFAKHDLTKDPPFSSLDLISCRNVLIYLGRAAQGKIIPAFHYALKPGGVLVLGSSEAPAASAGLFRMVDKQCRIYAKETQASRRVHFDFAASRPRVETAVASKGVPEEAPRFDLMKEADRIILSQYSPPGVIVDHNLEVVQFRGRTGPYLEPAAGKASLNLLKMLREGLAGEVLSAVHGAEKKNAPVAEKESVRVEFNGRRRDVRVEVVPIAPPDAGERPHFLISFIDAAAPAEAEAAPPKGDGRTARIERELVRAREQVRAVIAERESSTEELRVSNEEVLSSNEELQSLNEELETAKEELQSANEELTTLNEELQNSNLELTQTNNDIVNFLRNARIPLVMLDRGLRVRRYTPIAQDVLEIMPSDIGRPIGDVRLGIDVEKIDKLAMAAIDTVSAREREVKDREGRWYSMRILPYETMDNRIDGAVLAFIDIDAVKHASQMAAALGFSEAVLDTVREPLLVLGSDLTVMKANRSFYKTFKVSEKKTVGSPVYSLGNGQWDIPGLRKALSRVLAGADAVEGVEVDHTFPAIGRKVMLLNARLIELDGKGAPMLLLAIEDITERKRADALKVSLEEKETLLKEIYHRVKNNMQVVSGLLTLQSKHIEDKKYADMFLEGRNRIKSMALIHEKLYQSGNLAEIDMDSYAGALADDLSDFYGAKDRVAAKVIKGGVRLGLATAVPLGLVINELLSNSLKYAFPGGKKGRVTISLLPAGKRAFELTVKDNGVGLPVALDVRKTPSLGLHLVVLLAEKQLHGKIRVNRVKGVEFIVRFKEVT